MVEKAQINQKIILNKQQKIRDNLKSSYEIPTKNKGKLEPNYLAHNIVDKQSLNGNY